MPSLEELGASYNRFRSFRELPKAPALRVLDLRYNMIADFGDLDGGRFPELEVLMLSGNPICFKTGYREGVMAKLKGLRLLDGMVCDRDSKARRIESLTQAGDIPVKSSWRCSLV